MVGRVVAGCGAWTWCGGVRTNSSDEESLEGSDCSGEIPLTDPATAGRPKWAVPVVPVLLVSSISSGSRAAVRRLYG